MRRAPLALALALTAVFVAAATSAASPDQGPKRGGTLVVGRPAATEPACLNPFTCEGIDPALTQVLEGAFEFGPDLVARPNLVSDVTPGSDPPSLTYHIRPEARWSDGVPVTARDFQFTQDAFVARRVDKELWANVRSMHVLDAKTFRVVLRQRFARWHDLYYFVLPRHVLAGYDITKAWGTRIDNPRTGQAIGSGPFLVSGLERGRQITLVRNPRYWGPHVAYVDRLVQRFMTEDPDDPLAPIRERQVDVGFTLGGFENISADDARQIRRLPGWRVATWPSTAMEHFTFRVGPGGHPALKLKLVRQALAYGVDRVAIAREIQQEAPAPSRHPLDSTVFLPQEPFYQPTWSRYRYDVGRARSLLEQAGCRRSSDGIYECAGERLRLRFVTSAGNAIRERTLTLAAAQLRNVGVDVDPVYAPLGVFLGRILPSGDFDVALFAWLGGYGGVSLWPEGLCGYEENYAGYCSRLVARDARQNLIGSLAARAQVLNRLDAKLANAAPVLPIVQPVLRMFYRSNVRGLVFGGDHFAVQEDSENWWLTPER